MRKICFLTLLLLTSACGSLYSTSECEKAIGSRMTTIDFDYKGYHLAEKDIQKIARTTRASMNSSKVCVIAIVSDEGNPRYSYDLSMYRAKLIADVVSQNGIPREKVSAEVASDRMRDVFFPATRPSDEKRFVEIWFVE